MDLKQQKQELLNKLYEPYKACMMCPLGGLGRKNVVFGEGNPDANLIIIGEGPGREEDEQGRPFIGRSGKLLTKTLELVGITRADIFITNIVKCRPPNNRAPTALESGTCKNLLLMKQIKIIQPKIICTLGASALTALIDEPVRMTQIRGQQIAKDDYIIMPTFHPAYILRNQKEAKTFQADLYAIKAQIELD